MLGGRLRLASARLAGTNRMRQRKPRLRDISFVCFANKTFGDMRIP